MEEKVIGLNAKGKAVSLQAWTGLRVPGARGSQNL
jgi:hypothetical protein